MFAPDTVLQGRYRIISHIGKGGMGSVYLAKDENLGIKVAVKHNLFDDDRLIEAFRREARLLASLRHTALPQVKDHFTINGTGQFLVMEYISGDDLEAILIKRRQKVEPIGQPKPFEVSEVLAWAEQLLDALDYLHTLPEPVIHRDIKPQNLKLAGRNQIILLDFGLAKGRPMQMTRVTTTGSIYGYTPNYAPIEQIRGVGTDPRSDLYALAATLYHLVTGVPPADAATRADAYLGDEPDPLLPPAEINGEMPNTVSDVLMKAMAQHRNNRPASAAQMLEMLRDARHAPAIGRRAQEEERRRRQEPETIIAESEGREEARKAAEAERQRLLEEQRKLEEAERRIQQEEQERKEREEAERLRREEDLRAKQEAERNGRQVEQERKAKEERERIAKEAERRQREEWQREREREAAQQTVNLTSEQPKAVNVASASPKSGSIVKRKWFTIAAALSLVAALVAVIILIIPDKNDTNSADPSPEVTKAEPAKLNPGKYDIPSEVYDVSLSDDGKVLASSGKDGVVRLRQLTDEKQLSDASHKSTSVAVSRDGQLVASGSKDGKVRIWRANDGQLIRTLTGHTDYVFSVGFSPHGQTLYSASGERKIKLWRVSDGQPLKTVTTPKEGYLIITISPDLSLVGFYSPAEGFKLWSFERDELLRKLEGIIPDVSCGVFTSDGRMLALGSTAGDIQLWSVREGTLLRSLGKFGTEVLSVAFTRDGKILAAGFGDGSIRLWNVSEGNLIQEFKEHLKSTDSLAFSGDGSRLASGSEDRTIRLWSIAVK